MLFQRSDIYKIGGKSVRAKKIPIAQWRELFSSLQTLPQLLVFVVTAPAADRVAYLMTALNESFDDVVRITALLTGLDEEFIEKNAAIDELVAYYAAVVKVNNFPELVKNGQSVLANVFPKAQAMAAQDAI
ncbi:hypothetical protein NQ117_05255 [Paenibacillus sp. SC116]|uniref:hypothetical protein n=1 Tax=Paenibacillus sp. SC116 TaxID=2968986 RepID=UPI00215AA9CF|nr:hypothetical protein [Paenibacillus sp. SC116]MCR8843079.1 hypothetical protein [Paenibacillus sp. SC116]